MKKLVLFAVFAIALSGLTMAQTTPPAKPAKAKKEKAAPVQGDMKKDTSSTAHHHHQKHGKPKKA